MLLLLLAACAAEPPPPAVAVVSPAASAPALTAPPAPVINVVAPAGDALGRLSGRSAIELASLFGKPDFQRRDGPAEVWQYRARSCVLDFFFYDEPTGLRLAYVEARSRSGGRVAQRGCADAVAASRDGITASRL